MNKEKYLKELTNGGMANTNLMQFKITSRFRYIRNKFNNILSDIIPNAKKIILVYHGVDIDGLGCRIICELIEKIGGFKCIYYPCNKRADEAYEEIKENLSDYDLCIVADLNFTEEYTKIVNNNLDTSKIVLLDHHQHAMFLNNESWAYVHPHDIIEEDITSGTLLTFVFLLPYIECLLEDYYNTVSEKNFITVEELFDDLLSDLVNFVLATAAHDTWYAHDLNTKEECYKLLDELPTQLTQVYESDKDNYVDSIVDNLLNKDDVLSIEQYNICSTVSRIIQKQCSFMWHHCRIIKYKIDDKIVTIAFCYVTHYTSEIGNYILEKQPEVDFVMLVNPNINNVSFRSRTGEYNVQEIAKMNGGGGHQAASGLTLKDKDFFYDNIYNTITTVVSNCRIEMEISYDNTVIHNMKDYEYDKELNKYIIE